MMFLTGTVPDMATALQPVGDFFAQCISWMGDIVSFVIANPLVLVMVIGMPIAGFAVGLLGRLFRM